VALSALDKTVGHKIFKQDVPVQQRKSFDIEKFNGKTFKVVKVVDGDTLDIDIADGNSPHTRIRLLGVDTPETVHPVIGPMYFGVEASDFVKHNVLNKNICVYLDSVNKTRDRYGRLLAYVQLPDKTILNEVLLEKGLAYADIRFKHQFLSRYPQIESLARSNKAGLWQHITRSQLPQWLQREKPNLLKKAG
jgi:endonuclease YncB( thermonuclease family)